MFKKIFCISALSLSLFSTSALADLSYLFSNPILGIDLLLRNQEFERRFGREQFQENFLANNFYFGNRVNKCWGWDFGYNPTYRREKIESYNAAGTILGFNPSSMVTGSGSISVNARESTYLSSVESHSYNANVMGYYPICPKLKTELFGLLGVALQKAYYTTVPFYDVNPAAPVVRWSTKRRFLPRVGVGVNQLITKDFGFRALGVLEGTSKLDASTAVPLGHTDGNPPGTYSVNPLQSFLVGVGFFYQV